MKLTPLRIARQIKGFSISELGKEINLGYEHMRRIELNGTNSAKIAAKLVKILGNDLITELEILYPERYITNFEVTNDSQRAD